MSGLQERKMVEEYEEVVLRNEKDSKDKKILKIPKVKTIELIDQNKTFSLINEIKTLSKRMRLYKKLKKSVYKNFESVSKIYKDLFDYVCENDGMICFEILGHCISWKTWSFVSGITWSFGDLNKMNDYIHYNQESPTPLLVQYILNLSNIYSATEDQIYTLYTEKLNKRINRKKNIKKPKDELLINCSDVSSDDEDECENISHYLATNYVYST
jgi:hypothetical protein